MEKKLFRHWCFEDDGIHCKIFENGNFLCSGLTWLQATLFCSGDSLSDIGVSQFSLF